MLVLSQNSYVEMLTPKVMIIGGETFRKWLGFRDRTLMHGIKVLIKEASEILLPFPLYEDTVKTC
jgi:hypothetical protein